MYRNEIAEWFGGLVLHAHLHAEGKIVLNDVDLHHLRDYNLPGCYENYVRKLIGKKRLHITKRPVGTFIFSDTY